MAASPSTVMENGWVAARAGSVRNRDRDRLVDADVVRARRADDASVGRIDAGPRRQVHRRETQLVAIRIGGGGLPLVGLAHAHGFDDLAGDGRRVILPLPALTRAAEPRPVGRCLTTTRRRSHGRTRAAKLVGARLQKSDSVEAFVGVLWQAHSGWDRFTTPKASRFNALAEFCPTPPTSAQADKRSESMS